MPELASQVALLTNGRYTVSFNGLAGGFSKLGETTVTRYSEGITAAADGFHIYLRDLETDRVWSAGYQPSRAAPAEYACSFGADTAEIERLDGDIRCGLAVCVAPIDDLEIRFCKLVNLGNCTRQLDVTSYLEWVLGCLQADAGHPTFSKLFVETDFCPDRSAILARRRPRHADEAALWGFHSIVLDEASSSHACFETNRARFIGRGRTLERPVAMDTGRALSGDFGAVLDPIAALRIPITLEPGEQRQLAFLLGAAAGREDVDRLLESVADMDRVRDLIQNARANTPASHAAMETVRTNGNSAGERLQIHPPHQVSRRDRKFSGTGSAAFPMDAERRDGRPASQLATGPLQFDNGYGGFSSDGREYVIRIEADERGNQRRPPMPWVNVIANERAGFLVTESGAGYTWSGNSRLNRLTAWHNDPIIDPHSEALWIRDEDADNFWSPQPGPTPDRGDYVVRHGFGYTNFEHQSHDLTQETTVFMAAEDPVKLTRCRITNLSGQTRILSLVYYLSWALGGLVSETLGQVLTSCDSRQRVIWATNPNRLHYGECSAFSAVCFDTLENPADVSFTCDETSFIGEDGSLGAPKSLVTGERLDGRDAGAARACAAWRVSIKLPPGAAFECTHLLGEADSRETALDMIHRHGGTSQVQHAFDAVTNRWNELLSAIAIETPDREIDLMVNGWLLYQNLSCRMWGRSAYYQPGGAFGFRDQLQDSAAFMQHHPSITRAQILRHAAQQFTDGDVLHWWHPDTGYGVRTRFSDDLLWLPYIVTDYIAKTGDRSILDEMCPFLIAPALAEGRQEAYLRPEPSHERATVYEHCCRSLDRGLTSGAHGLPLIGCGDWNDGFSRVGRLGRGESVWLGFFIDDILERILPICAHRADDARAARYATYREKLRAALNSTGWDGAWYRRAYYDNGQPIGSAQSDECQIDALAQAWAVLSGVAPPERARMAMAAAEERLIDDDAGMIRLLTPAFNATPNDPGYIKGYLPGIRENGGQYTHGVLWLIRALAEMGRGSRAVELLRMLSPVWHASTTAKADVYQTEPYVVAADVYGEPPHVGRGGWTWYTGSAGWMFRVAVESILGFTVEGGQSLKINPSISSSWPRCQLRYRVPECTTRYEITIENPSQKESGVTAALFDGKPAIVENGAAKVPLLRDGAVHEVLVRL